MGNGGGNVGMWGMHGIRVGMQGMEVGMRRIRVGRLLYKCLLILLDKISLVIFLK